MPTLTQLHALAQTCPYQFPIAKQIDPNGTGLIAFGGDLSPDVLVYAYLQGLFPWFNDGEPIAWWSPDPRCVLVPNQFIPKKSLVRTAKKTSLTITLNHDFASVIQACSLPRAYTKDTDNPTWITDDIKAAYQTLHQIGIAHSIEIWQHNKLVGGLYGLKMGACFFGESMFHTQTDCSKIAFWALTALCQQTQVALIDCQLVNDHLLSLGAISITRDTFLAQLPTLTHLNHSVANNAMDWQGLDWTITSQTLIQ